MRMLLVSLAILAPPLCDVRYMLQGERGDRYYVEVVRPKDATGYLLVFK